MIYTAGLPIQNLNSRAAVVEYFIALRASLPWLPNEDQSTEHSINLAKIGCPQSASIRPTSDLPTLRLSNERGLQLAAEFKIPNSTQIACLDSEAAIGNIKFLPTYPHIISVTAV